MVILGTRDISLNNTFSSFLTLYIVLNLFQQEWLWDQAGCFEFLLNQKNVWRLFEEENRFSFLVLLDFSKKIYDFFHKGRMPGEYVKLCTKSKWIKIFLELRLASQNVTSTFFEILLWCCNLILLPSLSPLKINGPFYGFIVLCLSLLLTEKFIDSDLLYLITSVRSIFSISTNPSPNSTNILLIFLLKKDFVKYICWQWLVISIQ